jgi:hypothetical protein
MGNFQDFIDDFNDGNLEDIELYFDDVETFINVAILKGYVDKLNFNKLDDEIENKVFYSLISSPKLGDLGYKIILESLSDVNYVDGKYILEITRGELAEFFCKESRYLAEKVFVDEDWYEWYDYDSDNVIRDVIEEFNAENLEYFKKALFEEVEGKEIPSGYHDFDDDDITITSENFNDLFDNEDSLNYMLDELSDYGGELDSIYRTANNYAFESMVYNTLKNELKDFIDDFKYDTQTLTRLDGTKKQIEVVICDITSEFKNTISTYLRENLEYGYYSHTLTYQGSYMSIISDLIHDGVLECLSPRIDDYPDSDEVDKNINELLRDYI